LAEGGAAKERLPDTLGTVEVVQFHRDASSVDGVAHSRGPDAPNALWYTSGTTGRPKGVVHSRKSGVLTSSSWIEVLELGASDRGPVNNFFHIGMMSTAVPLLAVGGTVVLIREYKVEVILSAVAEHGLTFLSVFPIFLNLLDRDPSVMEKYDLTSVKTIFFGSTRVDSDLLSRSVARFPGAIWAQGWAQTEINSGGTCCRGLDFTRRFNSVGLPVPCVEHLAILDGQGQQLPPHEVGELCIRGPMVMLGYYCDSAATANAIRGGWLHTGDLGYRDEGGYVYLKGREREMIIRGGENVYPAEVEAALAEHPDVADVAVVGIPDSVMTEVPVAFVILREDSTVTSDELLGFASDRLARYKRPAFLDIVDELPRNSVGKVLKAPLVERATAYSR
jgi:acyl-CoA synthetase (AMP-forming)/AMP-acid ligase II